MAQNLGPVGWVVCLCCGTVNRNVNDVLSIVAQLLVPDVLHLVVDDKRAGNDRDCDGKLKNNEDIPEFEPFLVSAQFSVQHFRRLKGGQEKGRVAAGDQAHEYCQQKQPYDQQGSF